LLDVKNRVRDLSLRKNNLIVPIFGYRFSLAHFGEKCFGIERGGVAEVVGIRLA
jgi:hypothetical protein